MCKACVDDVANLAWAKKKTNMLQEAKENRKCKSAQRAMVKGKKPKKKNSTWSK